MRNTHQAQHHRQFNKQLNTRLVACHRGWMDLDAINKGAGRLQRLSYNIKQKIQKIGLFLNRLLIA